MNYYNENDIFCANWLYNLIHAKLIPPGDIDTRDIRDVKPTDLNNYKQCHFFAGIGGWPLALALAGVGVDEPLWTGSCPCQPFSAAGRRGGFSDERHLWPSFHYLIAQCRPSTIFGEQVAGATDWLRLVRGDLEALEYAVGVMPIEAASAGADHLRDRFWFVAHDEYAGEGRGRLQRSGESSPAAGERTSDKSSGSGFNNNGVANGNGKGFSFGECDGRVQREALGASERQAAERDGMAHSDFPQWRQRDQQPAGQLAQQQQHSEARNGRDVGQPFGTGAGRDSSSSTRTETESGCERRADGSLGDTSGAPGSIEWVIGADGKARRVKSGVRLLVDGFPNRVGLLRGFGNAIDPRPAAAFIKASRQ